MKTPIFGRHRFLFTLAVVSVALIVGLWIGCGERGVTPTGPGVVQETTNFTKANPQVRQVTAIKNRHVDELLGKPGIIGAGAGLTEDGRPAIVVLAKSDEMARRAALPAKLEGVPIVVEVTGEIKALQGGVDPTARFDRPVPIGVSTGHPNITAGTISCRVKDAAGNVYALSNNHVYADENEASIGDNVIQPGAFDGGVDPDDAIGTLADFEPIVFSTSASNRIDAAIALSSTALLGNATPSNGYGVPKSQTIAASVRMLVQKYGRTTELTRGRIVAINSTVDVTYSHGVARFVDQIVIRGRNFSAGGDSGSLIVAMSRRGSDDRKPVGLLFAGSATSTIANPIDLVLDRFGVTVDGE
ncbi:MAG: serine protease [Calditrichaeota bacterium]|nr:MAG: serine protease [Calditrichota bacterium]